MKNVRSSSIEPNTCIATIIATIFTNLKNSGKECYMQEASKVCILILKILDYMSIALANKIVKQILASKKGELAFKVLIGSNIFSKQ